MKDAAIQFVSLASDALVVTFLGNWPKDGDVPATGERVLQVRETTPSGISYNSELLEKWDASLLAFVSVAYAIPGVRRRKLRHIGRELPRSTRPSRRSNRSPPPLGHGSRSKPNRHGCRDPAGTLCSGDSGQRQRPGYRTAFQSNNLVYVVADKPL
ncbi:hypothetical protein [Desulfosediminicola sp.]|uniref:hypothetical protein n=1 Tax=Desulfosediminicola sp. TaxID=2886825 RepID=UPI003AF2ED34